MHIYTKPNKQKLVNKEYKELLVSYRKLIKENKRLIRQSKMDNYFIQSFKKENEYYINIMDMQSLRELTG